MVCEGRQPRAVLYRVSVDTRGSAEGDAGLWTPCACVLHSFCLRWDWGAGWGELPFGQPSFGNAP